MNVFGLPRAEYLFGLIIASVHAGQHLFFRLLPPLIPILVVDLETTLWQLGLLVTINMFTGGLFQAPMGVLSDRYDRLLLLIPAFFAMATGYLIFAVAPLLGPALPILSLGGHLFDGVYQIMAVGMVVAGIGYSAIHPVGYPLISANVSASNKGTVLGMWGSASKIGDAGAPLLIGVCILFFAWEWIVVGISLFGFCFAGYLFLVFRTDTYDTQPPAPRAEGPDLNDGVSDWRTNPRRFLVPMAVVVCSSLCILFAGNGLMTYTAVFVTDVYAYSVSIRGLELQPASIANFYFGVLLISGAVSQLIVGALADRFDYRAVLLALLGISTVGLLVVSLVPLSPFLLFGAFVLLGATLFGLNPARDALISMITPAAYEGRTFGYIWTIALVGSSAYPVLIGYLADTIGLRASFGVLAIGTVGGFVCIGLLYTPYVYRPRVKPTSSVEPSKNQ